MRTPSSTKKYGQAPKYAAKQVFPRAELKGQVMIHDDEHLFIAPILNVSAGGLFIDQLVSIPAGRQVKLVLKSTSLNVPVQAQGTVTRVERGAKRGLAVQFKSLPVQAREAIETFVFEARMESALKVA